LIASPLLISSQIYIFFSINLIFEKKRKKNEELKKLTKSAISANSLFTSKFLKSSTVFVFLTSPGAGKL